MVENRISATQTIDFIIFSYSFIPTKDQDDRISIDISFTIIKNWVIWMSNLLIFDHPDFGIHDLHEGERI